jgi:hypothetical protein
MSASQYAPDVDASPDDRSIDELDAAICSLARSLSAETYQMLVLVREFDERMGYAKWSFRSCAEWLGWRCGLSLSAAREKLRTAHALREMPAISAAFADGRLSYSKVRALTRVVEWHDEDLLLGYALQATAAQVEGALPADPQRIARVRGAGAARLGAAVALVLAQRSARRRVDPRRATDRAGRARPPGARARGRRGRGRERDRVCGKAARCGAGPGRGVAPGDDRQRLARAASRRARCAREDVPRRRRALRGGTHHHTLLHEGGFTIRRDAARGRLEFRRPEGRVIPRAGYRLDDMLNADALPHHPSAEVREERGRYRTGFAGITGAW